MCLGQSTAAAGRCRSSGGMQTSWKHHSEDWPIENTRSCTLTVGYMIAQSIVVQNLVFMDC